MSLEEFQNVLSKAGKPVLVMFSASFCVPCRTMKPIFIEASKKHTNAMFIVVDGEEGVDIMVFYHITRLPTIKVFVNGVEVDSHTGSSTDHLQKLISKYI